MNKEAKTGFAIEYFPVHIQLARRLIFIYFAVCLLGFQIVFQFSKFISEDMRVDAVISYFSVISFRAKRFNSILSTYGERQADFYLLTVLLILSSVLVYVAVNAAIYILCLRSYHGHKIYKITPVTDFKFSLQALFFITVLIAPILVIPIPETRGESPYFDILYSSCGLPLYTALASITIGIIVSSYALFGFSLISRRYVIQSKG